MAERSVDVIKRYVADAIAAEKSFETQLHRFAKQVENEPAKAVLQKCAGKTKQHYERLTDRMHRLEGSVSVARSLLPYIFGLGIKGSHLAPDKEERASHELATAYAVANSVVALYECLATMAEAAGDAETAELASSIQSEKRVMVREIWTLLPAVALETYTRTTGRRSAGTTA